MTVQRQDQHYYIDARLQVQVLSHLASFHPMVELLEGVPVISLIFLNTPLKVDKF